MVQERVSGNGNFDIDMISGAAGASDRNAAANVKVQPPAELSLREQQAVSAILEIVAEFAANRSTGSGDELEAMLVTAIAAKLPAGTHSQIVGEIYREVERRDRLGFTEFGSEQWERVKKEAKEEREKQDRLDKQIDALQDAQQQQAIWSRETHSLAGVTMTGEEWGDMGNEFRNNPYARQWLIAKLMRDQGLTHAQAAQRATEYADTFTAMSKPPSQRTPAERALIERAANDPQFREIAEGYQQAQGGAEYPMINPDVQTSLRADTTIDSVNVGAAMLEEPASSPAQEPVVVVGNHGATDREGLSVAATEIRGAPPVRAHFDAARTGNAEIPSEPVVQPQPAMQAATADAGLAF
jgi:hypothetical protein